MIPPKPQPIERDRVIDPRRNGEGRLGRDIHPPTHVDGRPITQQPLQTQTGRVIAPRPEHITIINNTTIVNNITVVQNRWDRGDHGYYWEEWEGHRIGHHYDEWGFHWWGFYVGDVYFWTRYRDGRYWWYDPYWNRWCYLEHDQWWWQNPETTVVYVYSDNGYSSYDDADGGVVMVPDPTPPVDVPPPADPVDDSAPAPAQPAATYMSRDASRMIQVWGDDKAAYLSDTTSQPEFADPIYLGSGVTEVRFSYSTQTDDDGNTTQSLSQILILTIDDQGQPGFNVFDTYGNSLLQPQPPVPAPVDPPAPDDGSGQQPQRDPSRGLGASATFQRLSGALSNIFGN